MSPQKAGNNRKKDLQIKYIFVKRLKNNAENLEGEELGRKGRNKYKDAGISGVVFGLTGKPEIFYLTKK